MKKSWQALLDTRRQHQLNLVERITMLLDVEIIKRSSRRTDRLMKNAAFRYHASIEQLRFDPSRGLDKSMITSLASCDFIKEGSSVIITFTTGCGKSFIASALMIKETFQNIKGGNITGICTRKQNVNFSKVALLYDGLNNLFNIIEWNCFYSINLE